MHTPIHTRNAAPRPVRILTRGDVEIEERALAAAQSHSARRSRAGIHALELGGELRIQPDRRGEHQRLRSLIEQLQRSALGGADRHRRRKDLLEELLHIAFAYESAGEVAQQHRVLEVGCGRLLASPALNGKTGAFGDIPNERQLLRQPERERAGDSDTGGPRNRRLP